mmetsp:Transcript_33478/g.93971  ORF Transcript_33478/g.93971 Transcript_33478/m.93971 type:complete len:248 (-) Transcript_33478:3959-4702(-)
MGESGEQEVVMEKNHIEGEGVGEKGVGGEKVAGEEGPASPKPRLVIHKMRLENFKSYGGVHEIGPFNHQFSAVVGPNGSGKSNVIDSMLFVFGFASQKIRMKKASELIHSSETYPNCTSASVTIFFREVIDIAKEGTNTTDAEVVPGSEMTVRRTVRKDGASAYYVNDAKVSKGEVVAELKGRGIDLDHNRFLILQGEVEQISLMKPKAANPSETGLLEYLEDIIGSNQFVDPIKNAYDEVCVSSLY